MPFFLLTEILLLQLSEHSAQTPLTHAGVLPTHQRVQTPIPLSVNGDIQAQKGSLWHAHLSTHAPRRPAGDEHSLRAIFGSQKGKRTTPRGLFWAQWDTRARPAAAFGKAAHFGVRQLAAGEAEPLLPDVHSPLPGSRPLSQWFILENEHTHTWLIIFGKYLNNLGVRQERTKVVKSMLDRTKNGTGSGAMRLCDKRLGKSLTLAGPWQPSQKIPFMWQRRFEDRPTSAECCWSSEEAAYICTQLYFIPREWEVRKGCFWDSHQHCPRPCQACYSL